MSQQIITPQDIFNSLPKRFKAHKASNYEAVLHFDFTDKKSGKSLQYTVSVQNGQCSVETGLIGTPQCVVKTSPQTYVDLELGKANPMMALTMGKLKVSNIGAMMEFTKLFERFSPEALQAGETAQPAELKGTASRKPSNGPLQGLRVLDLTRLLPGPLATMMMADMGAEVIKIESPTFYDYTRDFPPHIGGESAGYLAFNRSKRSLLLDYATPQGKEVMTKLIQTADIFIEQFRPGVMAKMGLDFTAVKAINPKIIYVSVTGYGQTGPYSQLAGHDLNYISYAGLLSGNQNEAPQVPLVQIADIAGGSYMAVIACLSAVYARQRTGEGQFVDVSMMDGVMPLAVNPFSLHTATQQAQPRDEAFLSGGLVNYGIYPTQDGKYMALGTLEEKFWAKFCDVVGKPEWKGRILAPDKATLAQYKAELTELFRSRDAAYWTALGIEHDVMLNPVYDTAQVEQDPHVKARQMVVEMEHPTAGKLKTIGVPLKFSATKAQPAWTPPLMGEDTLAILREAGLTDEQIQALATQKVVQFGK